MVGDRKLGSLPGGITAAGAGGHEIVEAAAQFGHRCVHGEQVLRGDGAESDDNFGLDDGDLAHEKRGAGFSLIAFWRAIAGRAAFHDVGDVDILAADAHGFDHVVEQLSGATDEGLALCVFVGSGAFADEHQVGVRIADAEDNLLAALLVKLAAGTVAEIFANEFKRGDGIGNGLFRI